MTSYRKKTETFYSFQCSFFGMWSFWNVPYLEFAHCYLGGTPFHYAVSTLFPLQSVSLLKCALSGMCPFWNVPYLTDLV